MACGRLGPTELMLIALLVLLLFGARRLPEIGRGLGIGIRRFRKGLRGDDEEEVEVEEEKPIADESSPKPSKNS
ncbi:MAG: twin-arginine translocase TatA/TatE family subunit [Candidatus Krumholzibacteriia bacterium]